MFLTKLRVLLGVLLVFATSLGAEKKITADWVETQLANSGNIRTYVGKVALVDTDQNFSIRADSAVVKGDQYLFLSGLSFKDSTRHVQAEKLSYDSKRHVAAFTGKVILQDNLRSLRANSVDVWPKSGRIWARGGVRVELQELNQTIDAEKLNIPSAGLAIASGTVIVATGQVGSETLEISTDSMTFSQDSVRVGFFGPTHIAQTGWALMGQSGTYSENWLHTEGTPQMTWVDSERADSVWAVSEQIVGAFQNQSLKRLFLIENASIRWQGEQDSLAQSRIVYGDSIVVDMQDEAISSVFVFHKPQLKFQKQALDISIVGDTLLVWFTGKSIDSLVVRGNTQGTYATDGKGTAKISGNQKTLWFDQDDLFKMDVVGGARCDYTDQGGLEENDARVAGQALTMFFENGDLTQIDALGKIRGVYLHSESEKNK